MANPSLKWDQVPVYGWWQNMPGIPAQGTIKFTVPQRIRRTDGRMIYPGGVTVSVKIGDDAAQDPAVRAEIRQAMRDEAQAAATAAGVTFDGVAWDTDWDANLASAIFTSFYASDDPDVTPNGWQVQVTEALVSNSGKIYYIEPLTALLDQPVPGLNLADIEVPPGSPTAPAPIYAKGQPGGIAALSADGQVLDADGNPVGGLDDAALAATVTDTGTDTGAALAGTFGDVGSGVARFIARAKAGATLKVVGLGDSILAGTGATLGTDDALTLVTNALATQFPAATVTQSNRSLSGATTALAAINGNVAQALADAGDLYVLSFGRNDVAADDTTYTGPVQGYARPRSLRYYEVMIRLIRAQVPQADIVLLTENPASSYSGDGNMRTYQDGVRNLAAAYGCELADTYAAFGTSGYDALLFDGVHPSPAGHQVYADTIMGRIPAALSDTATGKARASLPRGLRKPEGVDTSVGTEGWTVMNGSAPTSAYTTGGTGWNPAYPPATSTAGDYMEVTFTGTDFGLRVDQTATAAPVVDIAVDGATTFADQSLYQSPSTFQLYQFLATGLSDGQHTIRLTLKSGTLRWYQAAWLAGAPATSAFGSPGGLRRMRPGFYYTNPHDPGSTTISYLNAGDAYVVPIWVPTQTTIDQLALNVTTAAAGSTITLALYDADGYDQPRTKLAQSAALDTSTIGWKAATVGLTLQPGYYWIGVLTLGGAPRVNGSNMPVPIVASVNGSLVNPLCGYVAVSQTALPTTWTGTAATSLVPMAALRAT